MILDVLLLMAGFFLLLVGADKLVDGSSSLARLFKIPDIVIGLTIVAFGTSSPEFIVNFFASINNNSEMVMGNVIGSNIFNVLIILGICALIYPLTVKSNTTWIEIPLSLLAAIAAFVIASDIMLDGSGGNILQRSEGWILIMFFFIFLAYSLQVALSGQQAPESEHAQPLSGWMSTLYIVLGLAALVFGGRLIVTNAVDLAAAMGISERIIALTIVSAGTSLPELATSIIAVRKRNLDIAIGNVVGSNIFNIFFILGVSAIINPVPVSDGAIIDISLNILASLLLFLFIFTGKGRRLERWEGGVFITMYAGYIIYLLTTV